MPFMLANERQGQLITVHPHGLRWQPRAQTLTQIPATIGPQTQTQPLTSAQARMLTMVSGVSTGHSDQGPLASVWPLDISMGLRQQPGLLTSKQINGNTGHRHQHRPQLHRFLILTCSLPSLPPIPFSSTVHRTLGFAFLSFSTSLTP